MKAIAHSLKCFKDDASSLSAFRDAAFNFDQIVRRQNILLVDLRMSLLSGRNGDSEFVWNFRQSDESYINLYDL